MSLTDTSMNATPSSNRIHIAFLGNTNVGKSSIINALTNQDIAIVSDVSGTTTDPVYKAMEILPIGPCMLIDTAGLNDDSALGKLRMHKTTDVLNQCDVAVVVFDPKDQSDHYDTLIQTLKTKKIPIIGILNKIDLIEDAEALKKDYVQKYKIPITLTSAISKEGIESIKAFLIKYVKTDEDKFTLVGDLISPGDFVVLVVPIDKAAPKGRLILPQQQTIRDILESDAMAIVTKEYELKETLESLGKKPRLVITDSQVFLKVSADTPPDIPMTSFSILLARQKGDLDTLVAGAAALSHLKDGDRILISEGCTHHTQCDDIGTVKIPRWIRQATGCHLQIDTTSGTAFKKDLSQYKLIVHCGACMLTQRAMQYRLHQAREANVPIVNYGVLIAYIHGILDRALEPFPMANLLWQEQKKA